MHQAYRYFRLYPSDTLVIQGIVSLSAGVTIYSLRLVTHYILRLGHNNAVGPFQVFHSTWISHSFRLLETAQTVFSMHTWLTCPLTITVVSSLTSMYSYFYLVTKYFHLDLHGVWCVLQVIRTSSLPLLDPRYIGPAM